MQQVRTSSLVYSGLGVLRDKAEKLKSSVWAKVEHSLRLITCQFGCTWVRY